MIRKSTIFYFFLGIVIVFITSCAPRRVNPPPETIVLGAAKPVVLIEVSVENDVWNVRVASVQLGTPSESIILDRDLLIKVLDKDGKVVYRVSRDDPRIIYEEEPPEYSRIIKRTKGKFLVAVPYSPKINQVLLVGLSPQLKEIKKTFTIAHELKRAYELFQKQGIGAPVFK